jgi:transposase
MCLFVRRMTGAESRTLSRWLKDAKSVVRMRRAQVLAFSAQGMRVQEIAATLRMHEEYLRKLLRDFNDGGFDALKPKPRPGRRRSLTEEESSVVAEVAAMPPQIFGRPFNQWSLRKLRQLLIDRKMIPPVTVPTLRAALKEHKVSFQRTRTWKRSNDPDFHAKKNESGRSTAGRRKARRSSASTSSAPSR